MGVPQRTRGGSLLAFQGLFLLTTGNGALSKVLDVKTSGRWGRAGVLWYGRSVDDSLYVGGLYYFSARAGRVVMYSLNKSKCWLFRQMLGLMAVVECDFTMDGTQSST